MPTISLYAFDRYDPSYAGPFYQNHVTYSTGGWAWNEIRYLTSLFNPNFDITKYSVLTWERLDNEDVIDLTQNANNPIVLNIIDSLIKSPASRSGPVRTSYVPWGNVPSQVRDANPPGLHQDYDLLGTLNIDFHISTPVYCSDADGTITYYVFFYLDGGGQLHGDIQGWYYSYSGGGPFCKGNIDNSLNQGVPAGMGPLANILDTALTLFANSRTFWMVYLLPGRGVRSGQGGDNADNNVALAVLPN
jgi:hypothetical protein